MAASFCRRALNYKNCIYHIQKRTGYVVLIPETPQEIANFNVISLESLPDFSHLSTKNCTLILNQYAQQYDIGKWEIEEHLENQLKQSEKIDVFKSLIEPLEVLTVPFLTSLGVIKTLFVASRSLMPVKAFAAINEKAWQIRNEKFNQEKMYKACKKHFELDGDKCTEEEKRVLHKYIIEGFHNGFELNLIDRGNLYKAYEAIDQWSKLYEMKYANGVISYNQVISEPDFAKEFPSDLLRNSCPKKKDPNTGPWRISLWKETYSRYLEYCPKREIRYRIWLAYNQLASKCHNISGNATSEVESIRKKRQEIADILGFPSYAHLAIKDNMAGSVENVQIVLSELLDSARFGQEKEIYDLERFAWNNKFEGRLELWDLLFWQKKERDFRCGLGEEELKEYFPLGQVLLGLIALSEQLFGIVIEEQVAVDTWAPDVKYFRISDEKTGAIIGGFYFDPYARSDKTPEESSVGAFVAIRPRSKIVASLPLSSLIFNFSPPTESHPSLLYYREVKRLFQKFGLMLQFTLTESKYSEVSGLSNIEWDALEICSNFLEFWLSEKGTLESISGHYESGEPLPSHILENLCNIHQHLAGTNLCREIYFSNLDLYMHLRTENILSIAKELWPQHFLLTYHKEDFHPFGFKEAFVSPLASSFYSHVWSKMVAADVFLAFVEAGLSNIEEISALGKKFRATFLSSGGACSPSEVFRQFRGRDPDPRSLISFLDLPTMGYFEQTSEPHLSLPKDE